MYLEHPSRGRARWELAESGAVDWGRWLCPAVESWVGGAWKDSPRSTLETFEGPSRVASPHAPWTHARLTHRTYISSSATTARHACTTRSKRVVSLHPTPELPSCERDRFSASWGAGTPQIAAAGVNARAGTLWELRRT